MNSYDLEDAGQRFAKLYIKFPYFFNILFIILVLFYCKIIFFLN